VASDGIVRGTRAGSFEPVAEVWHVARQVGEIRRRRAPFTA